MDWSNKLKGNFAENIAIIHFLATNNFIVEKIGVESVAPLHTLFRNVNNITPGGSQLYRFLTRYTYNKQGYRWNPFNWGEV